MHRRPTALLAIAVIRALACASGGGAVPSGSSLPRGEVTTAAPARPAPCTEVVPGALARAIAASRDGDSLCLLDGAHPGPITVDRRVTIWGTRRAVIRSHGIGTTVRITAPGAALLGVTIDGSGGSYDEQDAAVAIRANDATVAGVKITGAVFGILADRCSRLTLRDNDVTGRAEETMGLRGDGIRLWEVRGSTVAGNHLRRSRDLVVWYSPGNRIERNEVTDSRSRVEKRGPIQSIWIGASVTRSLPRGRRAWTSRHASTSRGPNGSSP